MTKSKNGKIVILSILILFVAIILLLDIFVFTNKAYAAEEKVGEVVYKSSEWEDGSIGIMTRPQDTTVKIYRTGKNKYIMKATTDLSDYAFGVWCEWHWYVDGQKIDTKTFNGTGWNEATYTSKEFTHADNTPFTVHFYWHVNSGPLNGYKTTGKKTISAYDSAKPTLSGVTSGSIINQNVKIESSDNRSGSTIHYKLNGGDWISTKQSTYTFTSEGKYQVKAIDGADNSTQEYSFIIDKTAPKIELSGVVNGGFTNTTVKATWGTQIGGAGAQRVDATDKLTILYARSTGAEFPTSATETYTSGRVISEEGNYLITITDTAGNKNSYTFTIDKTIPELNIKGLVTQSATKDGFSMSWDLQSGAGKNVANKSDSLTIKYAVSERAYPTSATEIYSRQNALISQEGYYFITITDKAGNKKEYRVIIDQTAPKVTAPDEYLNTAFRYSATDPRGVTIEYRFNGGAMMKIANAIDVALTENNYGVWQFRAVDDVGNASVWSTVKLFYRETFENKANVQNGYKTGQYWKVNLSSKYYPGIEGNYSFASYEAALSFAISKEWKHRVVTLSGEKWSYVSISNESVTMIYTDKAELDKAINKYAMANISSRIILDNGSDYPNPTDKNGVTRPDALTEQNLILPAHLSQYAGLPLYLISHNFVFNAAKRGVEGNKVSAIIQFISNGITAQNGKNIAINFGVEIEKILTEASAWKQGYYLITESDLCGNEERYIVFLDTDMPTLHGEVTKGDGTVEKVIFDTEYIEKYKDVMLYAGLRLEEMFDNIDEFVMIKIDGRGLSNALYLNGDELPNLRYENGYYGNYTITLYDRTFNTLSFVVKIAGEQPIITHSSLTNDTRCRIKIEPGSNNAITQILFYKVTYDGKFNLLSVDDDGVLISPEILEYTLRTGGKYVIVIKDIYGRTVQSEPLFYMKGLPSGMLSGVKENGITNNTVTFRYENTNKILVYVFQNGDWVAADDKVSIEERSGYNYATIVASEQNSFQYKIFLYVAADMNLFTEYIFEIDSIPPTVQIKTDEGDIQAETVTRLPFRVTWSEYGISAYYYNKNGTGELGKSRYIKDTVLTVAGTYVFEIEDEAGNRITFNVTIDNKVSYTIEGNYKTLSDGSYIAKNYLILTVSEPTAKWECQSSNGINPINGQKLTTDGTYKFLIEDLYGNVLDITLIIDNLPPEPKINANDGTVLEKGTKTNKAFQVTCDEDTVVITYSINGSNYAAYDGNLIDEVGRYGFKLVDRMGNTTTFTIVIDRGVDFNVTGKYIERENGYVARYITLTCNEEYKDFKFTSNNGVSVELGKRISEEGLYKLIITDMAENVVEITIEIDLTAPEPTITTESGKQIEPGGKTKEYFKVECKESGAKLYYSSGSGFTEYDGSYIKTAGRHTFKVIDLIGNENIITIELDGNVIYAVNGVYKIDDQGRYVTATGLSVLVDEDYKSFVVTSDNGIIFGVGEKITEEGVYTIVITDMAENVSKLIFVVDKTAPNPTITTEEGENVKTGKTNKAFRVTCDENSVNIFWSKKDSDYVLYDGNLISEEGRYYFKIVDFIGNSKIFNVVIDKTVAYTLQGVYKTISENVFASSYGVTLLIDEEYILFDVSTESGQDVILGEKIVREGDYKITIKDFVGNVVEITLFIDYTPPKITLIGVEPGGTTNQNVKVDIADYKTAYYQEYGSAERLPFEQDALFSKAGRYTIFAEDYAGNKSSVFFIIDDFVSVKTSLIFFTDQYVVGGVDFKYNEPINSSILTVNGAEEPVNFNGGRISEQGSYVLRIEDLYGNVITYSWTILPETAKEYAITIPMDYKVSILKDGNAVTGAISNNEICLTKDGEYELTFIKGDKTYVLTLRVDTVKPVVEITQEKDKVIINNPSKENLTYELKLDGKVVNFELGKEIKACGDYVLTITDEYGNQSIYNFSLNYINGFGIAVIVIASVVVVGIVIAIIIVRKKQGVR